MATSRAGRGNAIALTTTTSAKRLLVPAQVGGEKRQANCRRFLALRTTSLGNNPEDRRNVTITATYLGLTRTNVSRRV